MNPTSTAPVTDRNVLLGMLACQLGFITSAQLLQALETWSADRTESLGQILLKEKKLNPGERAVLEDLVEKHLERHGRNTERYLATLHLTSPIGKKLDEILAPEGAVALAPVTHRGHEGESAAAAPEHADTPVSSSFRFTTLRPHALGGLGAVLVAYDKELHREVALKQIQDRHADDLESRARFFLEAEITGGLEHPGIVPVYSLGQYGDGRPYYAMRFIRGESLENAIERFFEREPEMAPGQRTLEFRQLLGRYVNVCNAIAYAHSRGIVHRDLKPSNVMLGKYGETLVVDWGIAKPVAHPEKVASSEEGTLRLTSITDATVTQMGLIMGTPGYMSPEQAAGRLGELGPASDIYSLGATLYCLLTGRRPIEAESLEEMLRRVQHGEFPSPRQLRRTVPPALEAVCQKAMALRPEDRYTSARALADDVEHWLGDEPVAAYPEPARQRLARWARRHRALVASAAALLLASVVALTIGIALLSRANARTEEQRDQARANAKEAERERQRAEANFTAARQEAAKAEAINRFLVNDLLAEAAPEKNPRQAKITVEEVVNRAAEKIGKAFTNQPETEAAIRYTIGDTYQSLGLYERAESQLRLALQIRRQLLGADHIDTAQAGNALAAVLYSQGKLAEAEPLSRQVLEARRRLLGEYHADTLEALNNLAALFHDQGKLAEAEPLMRQAYQASCHILGPEHPDSLGTLHNLASTLIDLDRLDDAEPLLREALDGNRRVQGAAHPETLRTQHNLALLLARREKFQEAEALLQLTCQANRQVMGPEHPETARSLHSLALVLKDEGKVSESEALFREALLLRRKSLPPGHAGIADSLVNLALVLARTGKAKEAEALAREGLDISVKALPKGQWKIAQAQTALGLALSRQKRFAEAEPLLLSGYESLMTSKHVPLSRLRESLESVINLYELWGKADRAAEWSRKRVGTSEAGEGAPPP